MPTVTKKVLRMYFNGRNAQDEPRTLMINVSDPVENVSAETVRAAMDLVVTASPQLLNTYQRPLRAEIVVTDRTALDIESEVEG